MRCVKEAFDPRQDADFTYGASSPRGSVDVKAGFKVWVTELDVQLEEGCTEEDQAAVRERLIKEFDCFPVFLDHGVAYRVFDLFCQSVLSPLFHHTPASSRYSTLSV